MALIEAVASSASGGIDSDSEPSEFISSHAHVHAHALPRQTLREVI